MCDMEKGEDIRLGSLYPSKVLLLTTEKDEKRLKNRI